MYRYWLAFLLLASACTPRAASPAASVQLPTSQAVAQGSAPFAVADGSRAMRFPDDFGAHPAFRTEWWYYTGNLDTPEGRHFGFELTIFRVTLRTIPTPASAWQDGQVYFAHFALSDVAAGAFHAFQRFSRPGPGLAGAQANPYRVWLEDWRITESAPRTYRLQAIQGDITLDLTLHDATGPVLHGEAGYSRKGADPANASYYYSQPRLEAAGTLHTAEGAFSVGGLAWMDHEFSTSALGADEIGWDWFALPFEDGAGLMLYRLRHADGSYSPYSAGTWIAADGRTQHLAAQDFSIRAQGTWRSPHTGGVYPAGWRVQVPAFGLDVQVQPWMADQELNLPPTAYWEGAVRMRGTHTGNGYVELTGYAGALPLP